MSKRSPVFYPRLSLLILAVALILPLAIPHPYARHLLVLLALYVILSDSLNFVTGFAGQLALGHAAFPLIGGYVAALLMLMAGWSFWLALLAGAMSAYMAGLVLGCMAMRLRGDYLGMVTLGFGEIVRLLALNVEIVGGPMGMPGIPAPRIGDTVVRGSLSYYYFVLAFAIVTHLSLRRLIFSRFGRACLAIREDEFAAEAMGINTYRVKVVAWAISSFFGGLTGALYAPWISLMSPDTFTLVDSVMMCAMITLGGIGSLLGPIFGAIIIGALPEIMRLIVGGGDIASIRMIGVGFFMIVTLIFAPSGLFGTSMRDPILRLDWLFTRFERRHQA